jgi:hypothetical protein
VTNTGRLVPDHKTIADFRKDNGRAIRQVCGRFVALCRTMGLLTQASVAIDGSKFKAMNTRDRNFTRAKMDRRMAQIEESVARYLQQLDTADRQRAVQPGVLEKPIKPTPHGGRLRRAPHIRRHSLRRIYRPISSRRTAQ